jgi:PAS domain S-box-containing protein
MTTQLLGEAQSADFLAQVLEAVSHPIFVKDRQHRWVFLNEAFARMVGHPREVLLGKSDHDFFPKAEADWFHARDRELFESGLVVDVAEEPITDAQGVLHRLATTKVPLRDGSGRITHLVGIIHDITALKAAEEALKASNEVLEQRVAERTHALAAAQHELLRKERLAVLGQLTGGLAHQIRNPLGAITNALFLLKRQLGAQAEETASLVRIIEEECWTANRIITDLLDYARVREPQRVPTALGALVDSVLTSNPAPAHVQVELPRDGGSPALLVDPVQLGGALGNLVRNALEAMPGPGTLTVSLQHTGEAVEVAVSDTGGGISPQVLDRLFEPLVTTKQLGLGLGLTTARALVENQGGTLRCENQPGVGARFVIRLPAPALAPGQHLR